MKEEILEPILRKLRIRRILPIIKSKKDCRLLDIGCGWDARFLRTVEPYIKLGIGIDQKAPQIVTNKIQTFTVKLSFDSNKVATNGGGIGHILPFESESFDIVTMLAVLEHLEDTDIVLSDINRVLSSGGILCGTVPSKLAKPILEFLSYRLHIVNPIEIRDHKRYYDRNLILEIMKKHNYVNIKHNYFQFGMNNFFIAQKKQ